MSVCHVKSPETFVEGKPVEGGLMDLRMGSNFPEISCKTCDGTEDCCGHFGHIGKVPS